ncbi:hypothetical protein MSG28_015704 [Choristoneura fumiferana]|uniref:Uncharacterized protein n=1 Tax=Choristoneura fumiferana TaxID=7141 RepID=A0ACC0KBA5_CHOFU|nr:hypothetical protein MSG28_015704 [Choristoneura fumiferana]
MHDGGYGQHADSPPEDIVVCKSVNESVPVLILLRALLLQDHMHMHVAAHAAGGGWGGRRLQERSLSTSLVETAERSEASNEQQNTYRAKRVAVAFSRGPARAPPYKNFNSHLAPPRLASPVEKHIEFILYVGSKTVGNASAIPLVLQMFMGGGDLLPSGDPLTPLPSSRIKQKSAVPFTFCVQVDKVTAPNDEKYYLSIYDLSMEDQVAQWLEKLTLKLEVLGSIPGRRRPARQDYS